MRKRGFTLIELLVVIAIIAILAAILFPVFARAREAARQSSCLNNQKQIGTSMMMYVQDYDEVYPFDSYATNGNTAAVTTPTTDPLHWPGRIQAYVKNHKIFQCPSSIPTATPAGEMLGYWANGPIFATSSGTGQPMAAVTAPADVVMCYDDLSKQNRNQVVFRPFWSGGTTADSGSFDILQSGSTEYRNGPHNEICNVLWADGHVKAIKNRYLKSVIMRPPNGNAVWP